jgi:pimeloyl-ACP methyl ester carboxylesterase
VGHQIDVLSEDFDTVAWDAPGCGGSSDPPETIGLDGYADCLAAFIDALGVDARSWSSEQLRGADPLQRRGSGIPSLGP